MEKFLNSTKHLKKQSIGTKVLFLIIFCGFFFALVETGVQLYLDYKIEIKLVEEQINQIQSSYLKSITKSTWNLEGDEVTLHLEGALQLRDIKYLEVRTETGDILAASGIKPSQKTISHILPLEYNNRGKMTSIGTLNIIASIEGLYQRLFKKIIVILIIRLLIALFLSGFFLFIFQHLVSRHLSQMAEYTQRLDINHPGPPLILNRSPLKDNTPDELERVVFAINEMQHRIRDFISEIKLSKDSLEKSEKRYRLIAENVADVIWTMDLDFKLTFISPSIYQQRGYSVEEAMNHSFKETLLPESFETVMDIFTNSLSLIDSGNQKGFKPIKYEVQQSCKDGSVIWTSNNARILHNLDNQPISILGITHNITDRKQAEKRLRASEERLKAIFMASPDPIVVYNNQGHPEYMNDAFTELFGWRLDELKSRCIPFVPEDQKELTKSKIEEIYKSGDRVRFETKRLTRQGLIINILLSAAIIKDSKGEKIGLVVDLKDMTESKKLEAQVQQSQKMESIGTLAGGIAHDFNNILFPVLGHTEMLLHDIPESSPIHRNLKKIYAGANRAKELVKQILTFSRQEQNELKLI